MPSLCDPMNFLNEGLDYFFLRVTLTASFNALPAENTGCLEAGMLDGFACLGIAAFPLFAGAYLEGSN